MSNISCKSCTLLRYAKKEEYLHEVSTYTFTNFFLQTYLIWAAKLDVPKIGILLSERNQKTPAIIVYIYIKHFILYGLLDTVSPILDSLHFLSYHPPSTLRILNQE